MRATMISKAAFNRLSISAHDFEKAIAFAEEAQRQSPAGLAYEALVFAAIVCYCRPFSSNERDKGTSATSRLKVEDFLQSGSAEMSIHEKCNELRNRALAHSEYAYNPTRLTPSGVIASVPFSLLSHAPDIAALTVLAKKHADRCHQQRADYIARMRSN